MSTRIGSRVYNKLLYGEIFISELHARRRDRDSRRLLTIFKRQSRKLQSEIVLLTRPRMRESTDLLLCTSNWFCLRDVARDRRVRYDRSPCNSCSLRAQFRPTVTAAAAAAAAVAPIRGRRCRGAHGEGVNRNLCNSGKNSTRRDTLTT